jgi:hypothetical protein
VNENENGKVPQIYRDMHTMTALCRGIRPTGRMRGSSYAEDTQVVSMVREAAITVGVVILPTATAVTRGGKDADEKPIHLTDVSVSVRFVSIADGSEVELAWQGQRIERGDKGVAIASTLALKQLLLKTFLIVVDEELLTEEEEAEAEAELNVARETWQAAAKRAATYRPIFDTMLARAGGSCYNGVLWEPRESLEAIMLNRDAQLIVQAVEKHEKLRRAYEELCTEADDFGVEYVELLTHTTATEIKARGKDLRARVAEQAALDAKGQT